MEKVSVRYCQVLHFILARLIPEFFRLVDLDNLDLSSLKYLP